MGILEILLVTIIFGIIFLIREYCKKDESEWTLEEISEMIEEVQKSIDEYNDRNKK